MNYQDTFYQLYLTTFCILMLVGVIGCAKQESRVDVKSKPALITASAAINELTEQEKADALRMPTKHMSFGQAKYAKEYFEQIADTFMAQKCAERILAVGGDQDTMRKTTLELAKAYLHEGKFEQAQKHASQYQEFYPGSEDIVEAQYITIQSYFLDTLNSERDQTKTQKTIELAQSFLQEHTATDYTDSVHDMLEASYQKLVMSELNIAQTYIHKYNYSNKVTALAAAQARIDYIRSELMPNALFTEGLILNTEIKLAYAQQDNAKIRNLEQQITDKYPHGIPQLAQNQNRTFFEKVKDFILS